jgi:2-polyprenyl-6-hydroxyphenyl methylase/3-demethylubiquinone-9 3-methyltransferase
MDDYLEEYGWHQPQGPHSCSYLTPAILDVLKILQPASVLDIGCGNGALMRSVYDAGFVIDGIERDVVGAQIARSNCPQANIYQMGVDDDAGLILTDRPMGYDCVISTEVVEHLYRPAALPQFAAKVLHGGGTMVITTPYHGYWKNLALALTNHWDQHHDPLWDGGHIKFFSKHTLTRLVCDQGFSVTAFVGVGRVSYLWKSMILVATKI